MAILPRGIERDGYLADLPSVTCESLTAAYQEMLRTAQLDVICLGADEDVVRRMTLEKLAGVQREPAQLENYLFMPAQPVEHFREEMDLVQAKLCMLFTWNQCCKAGAAECLPAGHEACSAVPPPAVCS